LARAEILVYARDWCSYCWRVKRLLERRGYEFEVVDATGDPKMRAWLVEATGRTTVPQVFIGGRPVGSHNDVKALDRSGELERLVAGG
jgi:glutaredoxin 3